MEGRVRGLLLDSAATEIKITEARVRGLLLDSETTDVVAKAKARHFVRERRVEATATAPLVPAGTRPVPPGTEVAHFVWCSS